MFFPLQKTKKFNENESNTNNSNNKLFLQNEEFESENSLKFNKSLLSPSNLTNSLKKRSFD